MCARGLALGDLWLHPPKGSARTFSTPSRTSKLRMPIAGTRCYPTARPRQLAAISARLLQRSDCSVGTTGQRRRGSVCGGPRQRSTGDMPAPRPPGRNGPPHAGQLIVSKSFLSRAPDRQRDAGRGSSRGSLRARAQGGDPAGAIAAFNFGGRRPLAAACTEVSEFLWPQALEADGSWASAGSQGIRDQRSQLQARRATAAGCRRRTLVS